MKAIRQNSNEIVLSIKVICMGTIAYAAFGYFTIWYVYLR